LTKIFKNLARHANIVLISICNKKFRYVGLSAFIDVYHTSTKALIRCIVYMQLL